ncbi:MAG: nuclear transport factor 2 family protein [Pseudomonadota bacterium]|nr:nuclear transport factor 2 family protein [Pseudomonadota bacterium]
MAISLKDLQDRAAIRDVLERYCRGIDRLDADLVNGVYWDEALDNHGIYKGKGKEFAAFVIPLLREHCRATMHTLGQSMIEFDGSRAKAETYFVAYHCGLEEGRELIETSAGRYVDHFDERDGEWRILDRVVVMEWTRLEHDVKETNVPRERFMQGRRDRSDQVYWARHRQE